ncbi:MAG: DUF3795 domain-containing protein [Actinobacteria bacterium]|nr:DUF3795 domain-containing protein [Actinomycetota bacterium]
MHDASKMTAYCGLCCRDCIPSHARLFELLEELRRLAAELHLESYAELISHRDDAFADYPLFARTLDMLSGLRCPGPCRAGGGKAICAIRDCARGKGLQGCWQCTDRRGCELLDPLRDFHAETIDGNLDAIAEYGMAGWLERRGKHYPWSNKGNAPPGCNEYQDR